MEEGMAACGSGGGRLMEGRGTRRGGDVEDEDI